MENRPTIQTIADRAGVSKTTVHNALHGKGRIAEERRQEILRIAKELGYRPDGLGRALATRRSMILSVILVGLQDTWPWQGPLLEGMEAAGAEVDYGLLLSSSGDSPEQERELMQRCVDRAVDGLILLPVEQNPNRDYIEQLVRQGLPVVLIGREIEGLDLDFVATDYRHGGKLVGQHLIGLGYQKIGYVGPVRPVDRPIRRIWAKQRLAGLNDALTEAGMPPATLLAPNTEQPLEWPDLGRQAVSDYLAAGGSVDAIFAFNDPIALSVMDGLKQAGLEVPGDVAVVGFDNLDIGAYHDLPLTSIEQPMHEVGTTAVELLIDRLEGGDDNRPTQRILKPPRLVVRESCGAKVRENVARCVEANL